MESDWTTLVSLFSVTVPVRRDEKIRTMTVEGSVVLLFTITIIASGLALFYSQDLWGVDIDDVVRAPTSSHRAAPIAGERAPASTLQNSALRKRQRTQQRQRQRPQRGYDAAVVVEPIVPAVDDRELEHFESLPPSIIPPEVRSLFRAAFLRFSCRNYLDLFLVRHRQ